MTDVGTREGEGLVEGEESHVGQKAIDSAKSFGGKYACDVCS